MNSFAFIKRPLALEMSKRGILGLAAGIVLLFASSAFAVSMAEAESGPSVLENLVKRGQETATRIASGTGRFSWTTRLSVRNAIIEVVNDTVDGKARRVLQIVQKDGTQEVLSIIERDHVWYVREQGRPRGVYRPFEAPLVFPNAYLFLAAGKLRFLSADTSATVESITRDEVRLRTALTAEMRTYLRTTLDALYGMLRKMSDDPGVDDLKQRIAECEQAIVNGQIVKVDARTGVILSSAVQAMACETTLRPLKEAIAVVDFDIRDESWDDFTDDPTRVNDLNDLIMIANAPLADAANAKYLKKALDVRLVNLSSKQVRRVPFRGVSCLAGCFSRDRKSVYVSGSDIGLTGLAIYEINLSTGENRRLGDGEIPSGMPMMLALSRDGTRLATVMFSPDLKSQIYVMDLKSEKAHKLGVPMDTAYLAWLKDGKGLVLVSREFVSMDRPTENSVARMDLTGNVRILVAGGNPVLVPGRDRILLQQGDVWKTCSLEGKNVELYAGGMKGYGFPAISANGKRVVWMRFDKGQLPQPVLQEFATRDIETLNLGPGLWTMPAWR